MLLSAMRALLILLLALTQFAAAAPPAPASPVDPRVPMIALIANPEAYDGRYVEVTGYLNIEFESPGFFVGKADSDAYVTQNAIRFDMPPDPEVWRALSHHYVTASGIFRAYERGAYHNYRGSLVVDYADIDPGRRQLDYLYCAPLSRAPLPWLLIIPLLAFAALAMGAFHLLRRAAASDALAGAVRFAKAESHGRPLSWTILVGAFTLFTLLTAGYSARLALFLASDHGARDIWFAFALTGTLVGILGAAAMWVCHLKGRRTLCAAFMLLQLAVPAVHELMRMDTWQAQLSYPFRPQVALYSWSRPGAAARHP